MSVFDILKRGPMDAGSKIEAEMDPISSIQGSVDISNQGGWYTASDYEKELSTGSGYYSDKVTPESGSETIPTKLEDHISTNEYKDMYSEGTNRKLFPDSEGNLYEAPQDAAIADGVLSNEMSATEMNQIMASPEYKEKYQNNFKQEYIKNPQSREDYDKSIDDLNISYNTTIKGVGGDGISNIPIKLNLNNYSDNFIINQQTGRQSKRDTGELATSAFGDMKEDVFYLDIMTIGGEDSGYQILGEVQATGKKEGNYGNRLQGGKDALFELHGKLEENKEDTESHRSQYMFGRNTRWQGGRDYIVRNKETGERHTIPMSEVDKFLKNIGAM